MLKSLWKHACIIGFCCSFTHVLYISENESTSLFILPASKANQSGSSPPFSFFDHSCWCKAIVQGVYKNIINVHAWKILHWSLEKIRQRVFLRFASWTIKGVLSSGFALFAQASLSQYFGSAKIWYTYKPRHNKTNKMTVCPAKTQISLRIRPSLIRVFAVRLKGS